MKKNYIKMNNNKILSLGNIINIIKKYSTSNVSQTEIFCSIFGINDINNTTVNNYCIGIRAIGLEYKNIFMKKYDNNELAESILSIVSILDNKVYSLNSDYLSIINYSTKLKSVIDELLTICSNDESVSEYFIKSLNKLDNYSSFKELLKYAIIDNKQPLFKQDINIKINKNELDDYLKMKLYYGQSYISSLIYLANKNNMYACAELGSLWFDGNVNGKVDYNKSYEYYLKAANKNHPKGCWMVANMILNKKVNYDFDTMWFYLNKSIELGSAAGYNTLGLCYKKGINPLNKIDYEKAKEYFLISSDYGYVFAFNNLGKLYEEEGNTKESIKYYKISADMGNSWALNKVGEYYRLNGDLDKAYIYYSKAVDAPLNEICKYAKDNLKKYYK